MSDEVNVNEEVKEEKATGAEEAAKQQVPDPEAFKAAIAANKENATGDQDDDEESEGKVNTFGFLVHCVIVVICVHGYLQYEMYASGGMNWFLSGASLLLPIINLWSVCCGLIYYWEIHWALALIITATCLLSLLPKAPGYICATISIALFIICASHTFPERKSEAQIQQELSNDMNRLSNFITSHSLRVGEDFGYKEGVERIMQIRARALRLGYTRFPETIRKTLKKK